MATQDNARQQTATQQQDGNSVVFSDANLTKLDERRIKSIGLYTINDLNELRDVLANLNKIFTKNDGLLDYQKIQLRINGESNRTQLTTDLNFPDNVDQSERRSLLFLSDYVRILIGIAKLFFNFWNDKELREYTTSLDELKKLADISNSGDSEYISEIDLINNVHKAQQLLDLVTHVFEKNTGEKIQKNEDKDISRITDTVQTTNSQSLPGTATVPQVTPAETKPESKSMFDTELSFDFEAERDIAVEAAFISSAAYTNLITQFLTHADFVEAGLPLELQQLLKDLNAKLKKKLWNIIDDLTPEQRSDLLSHKLRIYLYQKLLLELQKDPSFFLLLNKFYQSYAELILEQGGQELAEERINDIERYFENLDADRNIESEEFNHLLEKIRADIRAWKAQILEQVQAEKKTPLEADKDGDGVIEPDELEDYAITKLAPPRVHFLPQQESQLDSHFSTVGFDPQRRRIVQDQSARMLWGTLAELFKDDVDQLNKLPQNIRDSVYDQTLRYIMGLSPDELETLRSSPSSLIRHIKNNSYRILGDAQFQHNYSQYTETKTATVISRANRVEKETEWAYQQLSFELFGAHNISDPTVPDTPELQGVFDEVKDYLHETVFAYMEQVSTEELLHLYLHSKDRNEFLREVHKYLNTDQVFVENISLFYNNLLVHYEQTQQFTQRDDLQRSLNMMAQYDGRYFRVRSATPPPQALLDNSLEQVLKVDSKVVFDQSELTIRTLVLNLGLEDTLNLIQKNRTAVLESVFQLPPGTLTNENIEQYRALLSEYARLSSSTLVAATASAQPLENIESMYPGLRLDKASTSFTKPNQPPSSTAASQMESVRTVQTVVQSRGKEGEEVVASGTDLKTIKEKRDVIMKIFGGDWNSLSQADQAALYLYYDLPFNEQSLKTDINNRLPFIYEYIDFRAKKDYGKLLGKLSDEYIRHGKKNFNSVLKAGYLEATPSADHQRKINQLVLAVQAYEFSLLEAEQQLAIAQAAGYATAEALIEEQAILAQNALSNAPELNQIIQQLQFIDELLPEDLASETDVTSQSFLENLRTSRRTRSDDINAVAGSAQAMSPQGKVLGALQNLIGGKAKNEALKKGAATLAAKAGLSAATAGTATVLMVAGSLLQNKKFREFIIYGTTALVSSLLYALSTIGGLLGALLGASFGFLAGGPFAALAGLGGGMMGAYTGAHLFPQQWGDWMGFSPRQAPGLDMLYPENNASITDPSMQAARSAGNNPNAAAAAANSAQSLAGATTPASATTATAAASPAATTATATTGATAAASQAAATSSGFFTNFLGMSIGLASPMIALVSVTFLTGMTILVIVGAFLVPIPIRDSNWKGDGDGTDSNGVAQEIENRYLDVEKTASITQIENNTDTSVTYTIRVTPKNNHSVRITEVSDTFNVSTEGGPELVSGVTEGSFPLDPMTEPFEFSYDVMIGAGLTDARVTNTLIIQFEAIDRNGFIPERNGLVRTSASVRVGNPVEGCWPVNGSITQRPGDGFSHSGADAYDIAAPADSPVYAPYSGRLCKQNFMSGGYGTYVTLEVPMNGVQLIFVFGHLRSHIIPTTVPVGECIQVHASELIGRVDSTGNSTGHHLHYELKHVTSTGGLRLQDLVEGGQPSLDENVRTCAS